MARQSNEDRAVSAKPSKGGLNPGVEPRGGGKAITVNEQAWQLELRLETAEDPATGCAGADGGRARHPRRARPLAVPKSKRKNQGTTSATMEEVTSCLWAAFQNVASNQGAPGPDRRSIGEVREHLSMILPKLGRALLEGTYEPGNIRRVWIPKGGGGQRGLGIPNVVDRTVAEAVRLVLEPVYEPTLHAGSHGFRPGRGCHTAIASARKHIDEGYEWVVDLDLEKFFDRVDHQRLLARLSQRVQDKRVLQLIGRMLKAKVVMPDGVVVSNGEGVPQGGPLSPLLSNVVLDELDRELERRGHRFVRYADDCNVYVQSERAGQRVMASLVRFIEKRLRLKVNHAKSAVARPEERHFLGFRLWREPLEGNVEVLLSKRSKERIDEKIRELTPRTWGNSLRACIRQLNEYLLGWMGHFGICTAGVERTLQGLDAHIRRRLRAVQLKHGKRRPTRARKLLGLGVKAVTAWKNVYSGRKSLWALSHTPAVDRGLRNAYFAERGLISIATHWHQHHRDIAASTQLMLAIGIGEVVTRPASGVIT